MISNKDKVKVEENSKSVLNKDQVSLNYSRDIDTKINSKNKDDQFSTGYYDSSVTKGWSEICDDKNFVKFKLNCKCVRCF